MRKFLYLIVAGAALFSLARFGYPFLLKRAFSLSGRVEITAPLAETAVRPNTMLFVVASNNCGLQVAVKKIINPVFPVDFRMTFDDLIMPELLTKSLILEAFFNNHGELGVFRPGDIKSKPKGPVFFRAKTIKLELDTPA